MTRFCDLDFIGSAKFDETGRQRALDRLAVVDTAADRSLDRIVDLVAASLDVPICAISLIDGDRQWFKARRGLKAEQTARDIAFCNHAIRTDAPLVVEDATRDPRFAGNPLVTGAPHIRSYLGIPLKLQDGYIIGALCVADVQPRAFSRRQTATMAAFARLVTGELDLRTAASADPLTGALSRGAWLGRLATELDRAKRRQGELCALTIDIDHFRHINALFGHEAGDRVLRDITRTVEDLVGRSGFTGRMGGEELAVCLVGMPLETALVLAARIRKAIAELRFDGHKSLRCTASIGVAAMSQGRGDCGLLERSDKALYRAKTLGRDRVCA